MRTSFLRSICAVVISALLFAALVRPLHAAADHTGRVTLANGLAVPGVRVTATQGPTTVVTTTDAQGVYRFVGLAEGTWTIDVAMVGFSAQRRDVTVAAGASPAAWELTVQPFAEITRGITIPPPPPPPDPRRPPQRVEGRGDGAFQRAGVAPPA